MATEVVGIDKIKDLILNAEATRLDLYERKKEERENEKGGREGGRLTGKN